MATTNSSSHVSVMRLITIPAVITLAVSILRLVGELRHWSTTWFSPEAGGGGAFVGIVWLVPVFGIYFALELSGAAQGPSGFGKALGYTALGMMLGYAGVRLAYTAEPLFPGSAAVGFALMVAAPFLLHLAWPALFKTLLAYAYAARIPVAVVMFFAIRGSWGTHYDAAPGYPAAAGFWRKYVELAILPQLIFWMAFTILIGALFGTTVTAILRRRRPAGQASS
jgi:hypothetical protein